MVMNGELVGKVIFVTGASRGIGRAIAQECARQGAALALFATTTAGLAATAAACAEVGGDGAVSCHAVDAGSSASVDAACKAALAEHGTCSGLVNNAGITCDGLLMRMKDEDLDRVLDVNLKGAFYFVRSLSRPLMKGKGSIVNVSSVVGITGNAGQSSYAASKAGLIGFTKSIAKELGGRGVRANVVAPGFVQTDMTAELPEAAKAAMLAGVPLARAAEPREIAPVVSFLLSDRAGYVTSQVIAIDGGMV